MKRKVRGTFVVNELALFRDAIGLRPPDNATAKATSSESIPLQKIFRIQGRIISFSGKIPSIDDAALLLLLGQQKVRNNVAVTGSELNSGLTASGHKVSRTDQLLTRQYRSGTVLIRGQHRRRRYRLTEKGVVRAEEIARSLA